MRLSMLTPTEGGKGGGGVADVGHFQFPHPGDENFGTILSNIPRQSISSFRY